MIFKPTDFSGWVGQDVREDVIAKLLRLLGYEKGTENDILRGERLKLEYDREVHGRPKKTDRPIQSFPDYVLAVDKTWRWVIEAKPISLCDEADETIAGRAVPRECESGAL